MAREMAHGVLEDAAAHHEEAAHRVGDRGLAHDARQAGGEAADLGAALVPRAEAAAGDVARADDEIVGLVLQGLEHARQQALVMLQIGVHDGDEGCGRGEHALDAGGREAAPADALQAAHARIALRHGAHRFGGAVARIVVDEDRLPRRCPPAPTRPAPGTARYCRARSRSERRTPTRGCASLRHARRHRAHRSLSRLLVACLASDRITPQSGRDPARL